MPVVAMLLGANLAISVTPAIAAHPVTDNLQTQSASVSQQPLVAPADSTEKHDQENLTGMTTGEADVDPADPTDDFGLTDSQSPSDDVLMPAGPISDDSPMKIEETRIEDETQAPSEDSLEEQAAVEEPPSSPAMSPFAVKPPPLNPGIVSYGRWTKKNKVPMRSTNSSSASVVATIPTSGKRSKFHRSKVLGRESHMAQRPAGSLRQTT